MLRSLPVTGSVISFVLLGLSVASAQAPTIGKCSVLPADNIWNTPVDQLAGLHEFFGVGHHHRRHARPCTPTSDRGLYDGAPIGIPYITVPGTQTKYPATFTYADESDPGPYAIPLNAPIEGGSQSTGDRHALAVDTDQLHALRVVRRLPADRELERRRRAPSSTCSRTPCDPRAGRPRTPPACRSFPACFATTKSPPARSGMPSASPCRRRSALSSGRRVTTPPA